jgi:hypothetical protein
MMIEKAGKKQRFMGRQGGLGTPQIPWGRLLDTQGIDLQLLSYRGREDGPD